MYLLPSDPQMVRAMDRLVLKQPHVFQYSDPNTKNRLMLNAIGETLEKGKSILIIVPQKVDLNSIQFFVDKSIFKPYCLYIRDKENIDSTLFQDTGQQVSKSALEINFKKSNILKSNLVAKLNHMNQAYASINAQVIQNRSWKDLLQYVDNTEPPEVYQSFVSKLEETSVEFTYMTYAEVRLFLEQVHPYYQKEFEFLSENDLLNYNDNFVHQEWLEKLNSYSEVIKECIFDLNLFVDSYSRENQNQALKDINRYELLIEKIREDISEYRLNYGDLIPSANKTISNVVRKKFNAGYKSKVDKSKALQMIIDLLIEDLNDSPFFTFKMAAISGHQTTLEDYELWLSRVTRHFDNWKSDLHEYNSSHIKQLNCQNSELAELKHIDKRIKKVLLDLNKNEFLTKRYEDNTFSILKKIEFIRQLNYDLTKSIWRLENYKEYITFRVKLAKQTGEEKKLIDLVTQYDQDDWVNLIDYYFLQNAIHENAIYSMPSDDGAKDGYLANLKSYRINKIDKIKAYSANRRKEALDTFKVMDADLYSTLMEPNKTLYHTWIDLLSNHHSNLKEVFPIIIMKEGVFSSSTLPSHLSWDHVWLDNMTHFNRIDLDKISKISETQGFTSNQKVGEPELQRLSYLSENREKVQVCNLDASYSSDTPIFKELKHAERLKVTKKIASELAFANVKLRIFQLKNITILSYFGDYLNNQLIGFLKHKGLKEIKPNEEINYGVVDVLVSSGQEIIICQEDGLFDTEQINHIEWQHMIMKKLVKMGFYHVNIWSANIFMHNPYYVRRTFYKVFDEVSQSIPTLADEYDKS